VRKFIDTLVRPFFGMVNILYTDEVLVIILPYVKLYYVCVLILYIKLK